MIKIGIITFHCAYNYGAVLQTFALQSKLEMLGQEVEIINFRPNIIIDGYKESVISGGKRAKLYKIIKNKQFKQAQSIRKKRYESFDLFVSEFLNLSCKTYLTTDELENEILNYNIYICGSDQIWNTELNGNENAYYLSFAKSDLKKISYAPSFGVEKIPKEEFQKVRVLLSEFTALSAREEQGVKILKEHLQLDATHVLDPTLLITAEQWKSLASKNNKYKQK